jgi:predicted nucleic acid-binding protein
MIVVSDTSVLINLAWLDKLPLLNKLYGDLLIPSAVWHEVVEKGVRKPGADKVKTADWIEVREVVNTALVRALRQDLDAGEAEAIALAVEMDADLLLMDERLGRATAQHFGLRYIGLIGVLMMARQRKLITEIKPDLDRLRQVAGFYISESLYKRVLKDVAEA